MAGCITQKTLALRGLLVFLLSVFGDLVYAEGTSGKKAEFFTTGCYFYLKRLIRSMIVCTNCLRVAKLLKLDIDGACFVGI